MRTLMSKAEITAKRIQLKNQVKEMNIWGKEKKEEAELLRNFGTTNITVEMLIKRKPK